MEITAFFMSYCLIRASKAFVEPWVLVGEKEVLKRESGDSANLANSFPRLPYHRS